MIDKASKQLSNDLRIEIAKIVRRFGIHFDERYSDMRAEDIEENRVELSSPLRIIDAVTAVASDGKALLKDTRQHGSKYVSEISTSELVERHSWGLGRLINMRTEKERESKNSDPWDAKEATRRLRYIFEHFAKALELPLFCPENARLLYKKRVLGVLRGNPIYATLSPPSPNTWFNHLHTSCAADEEYKSLYSRLEKELPKMARLHMSTIGSSHKLPGDRKMNEDNLSSAMSELCLGDIDSENDPPKETIVIFDESGCIPAYELLGLTRLGRPIKALALVGDKHQLPPYDPMAGRYTGRRGNSEGAVIRGNNRTCQVSSLLDSSVLTPDLGKVMLTTQYRVPKDIADMLNHRVYHGQYNTCPNSSIPVAGLHMVNVKWSESQQRRKYVNPNEVEEGLKLLKKLSLDCAVSSTLVITPVRKCMKCDSFL